MYQETTRREFPEYFSEKGPLQTKITPISFGNDVYWMSSILYKQNEPFNTVTLRPYDDNDTELVNCEEIDDDYDIILTKTGKFTTSFYVPSSLLSYIVGTKATKLRNLEKTTNTQIKVPKPNEKGNVKIIGDTERRVASARTQINMIVMQRKDKLPVSHFVSIPMVSESIKDKFEKFKREILQNPARGVTESIFQNPEKLHLTITTLTLVDEEEINTAKTVLNTCYEEIISKIFDKNKKSRIRLNGLEIMNDDPYDVNVLYGNVEMDDIEKLRRVADTVVGYFRKSGLTKKQYDKVKLHVTLMNTNFRRPEERRETFDADDILKKYKNYFFGEVEFKNIHLSVRFTGNDQYYDSILVLDIDK
ncbi:activating signal cointegrator 1 complex subunit 1-like [Diorhabda sublineata]|uniref:activating signal cointegrator 1 complex subunit 1-like n=1 Tax=Diorhabda sublineata TaxID=1163346 RepID=UPI0024E06070|nr:activating signal cointegrator 1 complex subunit 1-like [Diorhabda sublineata]